MFCSSSPNWTGLDRSETAGQGTADTGTRFTEIAVLDSTQGAITDRAIKELKRAEIRFFHHHHHHHHHTRHRALLRKPTLRDVMSCFRVVTGIDCRFAQPSIYSTVRVSGAAQPRADTCPRNLKLKEPSQQGCIGGYTRVYAVYHQPPVIFACVYSPRSPKIGRVYAIIRV